MNKDYDHRVHSHVTINIKGLEWEGPHPIVHHTGEHVWIGASYMHELPKDVLMVGDGRSNGFDAEGCCIVSVPRSYVWSYLTFEEAQQLENLIYADSQLLAYASG